MDLRRSLSNRIPYALSGERQDEMRTALAVTQTADLQSLGVSWERRGWLAPKLTRAKAPRKPDSPERQAWREQKARRRALLSLL